MPYTSEICYELLASIDVKKLILEDRALLSQIEGLALECLEALHAGAKIILQEMGVVLLMLSICQLNLFLDLNLTEALWLL